MARGNDAADAQAELEKRIGTSANAEALIEASKDAHSPELRAALNKRENPEARDALDIKDVQKAAGDGKVLGYQVHGDYVVIVAETSQGRAYKFAVALDDIGASGKKAAKEVDPVDEVSVSDPAADAQAQAEREATEAQKAADAADAAAEAAAVKAKGGK